MKCFYDLIPAFIKAACPNGQLTKDLQLEIA